MEKLIFYPWNSYYSQYFIRSCGGDYGTPLNYHPWRGLPKSARDKEGQKNWTYILPVAKIYALLKNREAAERGLLHSG
eukprot:scaffold504_cov189-Ochromonas_danica.AAC.6